MGSSPLTRGKLRRRGRLGRGVGLIPAHAGKTQRDRRLAPPPRAHPRSRGENAQGGDILTAPEGSSPLTRGKPFHHSTTTSKHGLIPAHAGKTSSPRVNTPQIKAHPRSRGENLLLVLPSGSIQGSSPLTRGKLTVKVSAHNFIGLIPAHAGKTGKTDVALEELGAHPRSRGENPWPWP